MKQKKFILKAITNCEFTVIKEKVHVLQAIAMCVIYIAIATGKIGSSNIVQRSAHKKCINFFSMYWIKKIFQRRNVLPYFCMLVFICSATLLNENK